APVETSVFQGAAVFHTDISTRKFEQRTRLSSDRRLDNDFADLKRFHEISTRCVTGEDVDATLRDIVSLAVDVTHADMGVLLALNQHTGELEVKTRIRFKSEDLVSGLSIDTDRVDSASALAVQTKRQIVVPNVSESEIFAASPLLPRLRTIGA